MKNSKRNLSDLEIQVLRNIAYSEYIDVCVLDQLIDYPTWSFVATTSKNGYTSNQLKGGLGSLVKKGICYCDNSSIDDSSCCITAEGVELIKLLNIDIKFRKS